MTHPPMTPTPTPETVRNLLSELAERSLRNKELRGQKIKAENERDAARAEVEELQAAHHLNIDELTARSKKIDALRGDKAAFGKTIGELRAEVERLKAALQFYANEKSWEYPATPGNHSAALNDDGDIARKALEERK